MPRFGIKTLLVAFVVVALWLSTFSAFAAAQDLRRSLLLLLLITATALAVYGRGRRRAFWAGFATVMFLCGGLDMQRPLNRYVPDFAWQWLIGTGIQPSPYGSPYPPVYSVPSPYPVYSTGTLTISSTAVVPTITPVAPAVPSPASIAFRESLVAGWILAVAALSGFIMAYVYSRSRPAGTSE